MNIPNCSVLLLKNLLLGIFSLLGDNSCGWTRTLDFEMEGEWSTTELQKQKFGLSCSFRCDQIHTNHCHKFGHTIVMLKSNLNLSPYL
jgi:hypothetical protein